MQLCYIFGIFSALAVKLRSTHLLLLLLQGGDPTNTAQPCFCQTAASFGPGIRKWNRKVLSLYFNTEPPWNSKRSQAAAVSQVKVHMSPRLRRLRLPRLHDSHRARITVWQRRPCTCPMSLFVCVQRAECVWTEPNISTAALRVIKTSTDTQLAFILSLRPPWRPWLLEGSLSQWNSATQGGGSAGWRRDHTCLHGQGIPR